MARRGRLKGFLTFGALVGAFFLQTWFAGVNRADEVWFFVLAKKTAEGAVPYRDFSFNVLPGSLYLAAGFLRVFGAELVVLKGLMALVAAATALLAWGAFRQLGGPEEWKGPFLLLCLLLAPALPGSAYGPLAYLALLAALVVTLNALPQSSWIPWLGAGFFAGLGFVAKYNLGMLVLGAVGLARLLGPRKRRFAQLFGIAAIFAATVLASLWPVAVTRTWGAFYLSVLGTKPTYVRTALTLPLAGQIAGIPPAVVVTPTERLARLACRGASFLTVALGAIFWLQRWRGNRDERRKWAVLGLFLLAAVVAAFPRFDSEHVLPAVPVALVSALGHCPERRSPMALAITRCTATAFLVLTLCLPLLAWARGAWHLSDWPHLRAVRISPEESTAVEATRLFARTLPPNDNLLFLGPYAAFYYLVTERRPPTRYLFPLASQLGPGGEDELISKVKAGHIPWVCLQPWPWALRPQRVEECIQKHLLPIAQTGECFWYAVRHH
ncbi:MAG: glycosyltransferase family 39 protein [Thermoanaerobaculum sp.]